MLLYAGNAVIFAKDEKFVKLGLDALAEWCSDCQLKVHGRIAITSIV